MVNQAINFALDAHKGQMRKGTALPYIVHPLEVLSIVSHMTDDPEILAAAVLHDTVEDCKGISLEKIEECFGSRVAFIVSKESEDKTLSWKERKQSTIDRLLIEDSIEVMMIALGDKLSNIRSLYHDYQKVGDEVWNRFRMKDKKMQGWYYKGLCYAMKSMEAYLEYQELCDLVEKVFD